ncbi:MAG: hypothetical protein CVU39_01170 [Chloroflexi bacterium HGW-Chloroflexi-10]|nr:MAG: hypothetical protein CVU39_01170 [Chloroflexi bacterium HGW-Chloroflexi-10]
MFHLFSLLTYKEDEFTPKLVPGNLGYSGWRRAEKCPSSPVILLYSRRIRKNRTEVKIKIHVSSGRSTPDALITAVDMVLYFAKHNGRNGWKHV